MKTKLSILLLSALIGLTACNDDFEPQENQAPEVFMQEEPDYSSVTIDAPVFLSPSIKAEVRDGLQTFLTNTTSLEGAEVAVVSNEDIGTYEGELLALYQRGGFIIVAQPDGERYKEFAAKYGLPNVLPFDASQEVLLYVTSNKREHYVLYSTNPFNPEEINDPVVLSMLEQQAQSYYKRRIFEMCRWLKDQRNGPARTRRAVQYVTQFNPIVLIQECDIILQNFSIPMSNVVADRLTSPADWITVTGSVDVRYTVYSAYVFEGNSQPGDYYIVKMNLTVRNGSSFTSFTKKHGGVYHYGAGYYMKQFDLTSAMVDPSEYIVKPDDDQETIAWKKTKLKDIAQYIISKREIPSVLMVPGIYFLSDPSPGTTIGSTSYTSGIDIGLNGSLSAGTWNMGASLGFSANYSHSESVTISDITIQVNTQGDSKAVKNTYITRPIGSFTVSAGHDENDVVNLIPLVARSDFNAQSVWCWTVPAGVAVGDGSHANFMLATCFDYEYASFVHSTDTYLYDGGYHYSFHAGNYSYAQLPYPNREPFGVIALKNNESLPIYNISIWSQDEHAGQGDPLYVIDSGYQPGEEAMCAVPVGTYYIEFSMKYKQPDDPTIMVESRWKIENVKVQKATDQNNTTRISSGIAQLIE